MDNQKGNLSIRSPIILCLQRTFAPTTLENYFVRARTQIENRHKGGMFGRQVSHRRMTP